MVIALVTAFAAQGSVEGAAWSLDRKACELGSA